MATTAADLPLEALIPDLPVVRTYLSIPGIQGDATARGHEGWIEVHSFAWAVSRGTEIRDGGGGRSRSIPSASPLRVRAVLDSSGPLLFDAVTRGRSFASAVLETSQENGPVVLSYELVHILVSSYQLASVAAMPVQTFDVTAERMTFTYRRPADDGSTGTGVSQTWDVGREH
ncbi:MAG: type VI secretion system tube protein Hcp [Ornithinibacter sp.]